MSDPVTILIVDDSKSDRLLCRRYIQKSFDNKYEILEADSVSQAIDLWQSHKPDVTLVDFNLHDSNGLKFLESIRKNILSELNIGNEIIVDPKLPVIMMTGSDDERVAVNAMKLGAFDYLFKNEITAFSLCQSIQNLLQYIELRSKLARSQKRESIVAQISLNIRQFLNLEDICHSLTKEIGEFLQTDRTLVYKFNPDMSRQLIAEAVVEPWQSCINALSDDSCVVLSNARKYESGKALIASDIYQVNFSECHVQMLEKFQVRANIVIPILLSETANHSSPNSFDPSLWGLLIVHQCSASRVWMDDEIQLLQQLAVQLVIAIQQAEIYQNLQKLNSSLEQQIQERTSKLQASEQKSRAILTALPDIINLISADGIYLESNRDDCISDLVSSNPIGKHIMEILPEKIAIRQFHALQNAISSQEMQIFEQNFEIDQRSIYEEVRIVPIQEDVVITIVRDISDLKLVELSLQNSLQREQTLNQFIQTIRSSLDLEFIFNSAMNAIANLLDLEQVAIVKYIPERKIWKHIAVFRNSPEMFDTIDLEIADDGNPLAQILKQMEIVQINDTSEIEDEANRKLAEKAKGAWLMVPVIVNGKTWGSLSSRKSDGAWLSQEIEMAQAISTQLGIAIQQSTLYQQLQLELAEREKTEIALAKAKDLAEAANKAKSEFLANMSHEIRTPMNGVLGMAQLLATTPLQNNQKNFVQIILDSGDALLTIINDVLDLSKIESGNIQLEAKEFNFIDVLNSACNLFTKQLADKNIDLKHQIAPDLPNTFIGDSSRLRQVLINLIGNAIKFTAQGHILISVNGRFISPTVYEFKFAIADTGIGIDGDRIRQLFNPFTQADASISRQFGGTGLGLAICKRLIELMNGTIWIESRGNVGGKPLSDWTIDSFHDRQGSIFYFAIELPATSAKQPVKKPEDSDIVDINAEKEPIKILIVEDNIFNQKITALMIEKLGYKADVVEDGQECITTLSNCNTEYDVIFMDVQMPVMDGIMATKLIRKNSISNIKPWIIALTADVLADEQKAYIDAGMNDFIGKPVSIKEIAKSLSKYIAIRNQ